MDAQRVQRKLKAMERYIERYYWEAVLQCVILPESPSELGMVEVMGSPLKQLLWLVIGARIVRLMKVRGMEEVCQSIFLYWRAEALEYMGQQPL